MNINWNADKYTEQFGFVHHYGEDVLKLLDLTPGQTVLDLGCGNGALTEKLDLAGAKVIGMDASAEMLKTARALHPDLTFLQADATDFSLEEPADAVFSNAVFHWIDDQDALLSCIRKSLKPGGQLVCEFGGHGCAGIIHDALAKAFSRRGIPYANTFYFPTIGEYTPILERHGLRTVYASLFDRFTPLEGPDGVADWIRMFIKEPFSSLSPETSLDIIKEAAEETRPALFRGGIWHADYVRIRLKAVRVD
ncbi:class I SAM-dependent methyltransferase [Qiania dongpingensis]|uniref:Methyltransferase domain-containing protein n=1 Tax=Qiania dongpingensis TaxID=2763669 RepID=A0A7G9G7R1_9FIRM|nr:class I SAM-dependent methyltransferase [Qiania dongpingensis]QNM06843.1 methyltransferase domain-containing protein [Qiania dongpingensis]